MDKKYYLVLLESNVVVKKLVLGKGRFVIGRSEDTDMTISSKDVSRHHTAIVFDGTSFVVEDLDSMNGTFVNGTRVKKTTLKVGDEINIGDYTVILDDGTGKFSSPEVTEIGHKGAETVILESSFSTLRQKLKDKGLQKEFKTIEDVVKKSRKRLSTLANEDKLTGLYNRQFFDETLKKEFDNAQKKEQDMSLLFIDIDFFKKVNDTHGHAKGDDALRTIAQLVRASCRKSDFVARYGGEEIVVILPDTVSRDAIHVAKDINTIIALQTKNILGFKITVSIGVATFPHDASTLKGLLKNADKALYKAKQTGRNKVWKFDEKRD